MHHKGRLFPPFPPLCPQKGHAPPLPPLPPALPLGACGVLRPPYSRSLFAPRGASRMAQEERAVVVFFEGEAYRLPLDFILRHPDGEALLLPYAGQDITDAFYDAGHSRKASRLLRRFRVVAEGSAQADTPLAGGVEKSSGGMIDLWDDDDSGGLSPSSRESNGGEFAARGDRVYGAPFDYSEVVMQRRCPMRKVLPVLKRKTGDHLGLLTVMASALVVTSTVALYLRATRR